MCFYIWQYEVGSMFCLLLIVVDVGKPKQPLDLKLEILPAPRLSALAHAQEGVPESWIQLSEQLHHRDAKA